MNWALCLFTVGNTFSRAKVTAAECSWLKKKREKKKLAFLAEWVNMPLSSQYSNSYLFWMICTGSLVHLRLDCFSLIYSKSMRWPTLASSWKLEFPQLIQQVHGADGARRWGEVQSGISAPGLAESTEQSASFCPGTLSPGTSMVLAQRWM